MSTTQRIGNNLFCDHPQCCERIPVLLRRIDHHHHVALVHSEGGLLQRMTVHGDAVDAGSFGGLVLPCPALLQGT
eukprot:Skav229779  [mRNA]  locus=scaffold519:121014:122573:- [translate_table: standard]